MGEISMGEASVLEDASLVWSEEHVLVEPCLEEAPFKELCGDIVMGSIAPSTGLIDSICIELLYLTPTSSPLFPTTPSYVHALHESLGAIRGYYSSLNPYCAPEKICLQKSSGVLSLIMLLLFPWHLISLRGHQNFVCSIFSSVLLFTSF